MHEQRPPAAHLDGALVERRRVVVVEAVAHVLLSRLAKRAVVGRQDVVAHVASHHVVREVDDHVLHVDDVSEVPGRVVVEVVLVDEDPLVVVTGDVERLAVSAVREQVVGDVALHGRRYGFRLHGEVHPSFVPAHVVVAEVKDEGALQGDVDGGRGGEVEDGDAVVVDVALLDVHRGVDLAHILVLDAAVLVALQDRLGQLVEVVAVCN